jgi:mRNA degradation ribonuclease J1/J2
MKQKSLNINGLKNTLIQMLKPYIYELTEKYPVILPIINVIE